LNIILSEEVKDDGSYILQFLYIDMMKQITHLSLVPLDILKESMCAALHYS